MFSEAMTGLFYAPKEFIAYGNRAGFENYFPNWHDIADLVGVLPDRETIRTDLYGRPK